MFNDKKYAPIFDRKYVNVVVKNHLWDTDLLEDIVASLSHIDFLRIDVEYFNKGFHHSKRSVNKLKQTLKKLHVMVYMNKEIKRINNFPHCIYFLTNLEYLCIE